MSILSIVTSLITLGANASWITGPLMGIVLKIDGWIYELVSLSFNLFLLMCSVNFNSISGLIAPLLDRIQAVILVFVVFKLGVSLITYLLNPEKAAQEGSKIIINVFITAAFLIGYNFVFGVFNELNLLIMGNPTNYPYTTLSSIAELTNGDSDKGLIMRFIFGDSEEVEDVGDFLAFETLSIFIYNWDNPGGQSILEGEICKNGKCDFASLDDVSGRIGKTLEFHPGGLIIGLFLIYSIVKSSIQVGIRMFKLIILQMLAPIAIVTILSDGIKSKTFQNYVQKYISVFLEAFIRMLSTLIITVFVCQFFVNSNDFFGNLPGDSGWVQFLIKLLLVAAGYQFASELPKFIDEIIGTHIGDGGKSKGMEFLGGLIGGGIGAATGLVSGVASGISGGAGLSSIGNGIAGAVTGAGAGFKGNTIAEKMKNLKSSRDANYARAQNIAARGGLGAMAGGALMNAVGVGRGQDRDLAKLDKQSEALEAYDAALKHAIKDEKLSGFSSEYVAGYDQVKFGEDKDAYASQMLKYDKEYIKASAALEQAKKSGTGVEAATVRMQEEAGKALERAKKHYDDRKATAETAEGGKFRADIEAKKAAYEKVSGKNITAKDVGTHRKDIYAEKAKITNSSSYAKTHGQKPQGK